MTTTRLRAHFARASAVMALVLAAPFVPAPAGAAVNDVSTVATGFSLAQRGVRVGNFIYATDQNDQTVKRIDPSDGTTIVYAGTSGTPCDHSASDCGDDGPAADATLANPQGLATDGVSLYVGEMAGARIRRILIDDDPSLRTITTFAGTTFGDDGDGGPALAAKIALPTSMAWSNGRLYFGDMGTNKIRCIGCTPGEPTWISTVVGTGKRVGTGEGQAAAPSPDGTPAASADLFTPAGITVDPDGNVVFTQGCDIGAALGPLLWGWDGSSASFCDGTIRRVKNGVIQTIVGKSGRTGTDDKGAATGNKAIKLLFPGSVAYRPDGTLYFTDLGAEFLAFFGALSGGDPSGAASAKPRILCLGCSGTGKVSKIAGNGFSMTAVDGPGTQATVSLAALIDDRGTDVYFLDLLYGSLRKIEGQQPNLWASPPAFARAVNPSSNARERSIVVNLQNRGRGGVTGPVTASVSLSGAPSVSIAYASWTAGKWACTRSSSTAATCVYSGDIKPAGSQKVNVWVTGTGNPNVSVTLSSPSRDKDTTKGAKTATVKVK